MNRNAEVEFTSQAPNRSHYTTNRLCVCMSNALACSICSDSTRHFKEMLGTFSLFLFVENFYLATYASELSAVYSLLCRKIILKVDMTFLLKSNASSNILP